jgi:hypothetical protein
VDTAGRFDVAGVAPGNYAIHVMTSATGTSLFGTARFTVADADIRDIVVFAKRTVDIAGRVILDEPDRAVPGVHIDATRIDADGGSQWHPSRTDVADDNTFVLRGVAGPIIVRAITPDGWFLKQVRLNGDDVTDRPVELGPQDSGHLEVVLTRRLADLQGTVTDDEGAVTDCDVVLFSANKAEWFTESTRLRVQRPGSSSRFRFAMVRAGRYWVAAVRRGPFERWAEAPARLEALIDGTTEVVIADGEHKVLDLKLSASR